VPSVSFEEARKLVIERILADRRIPPVETVALTEACGRVLAENAISDRDYPPLTRSIRDGFAVRASETPGVFHVSGEVRAGERLDSAIGPGQAVEIMTGAPLPPGADAVVMVERVERTGETIRVPERATSGQFINPKASEAGRGDCLLRAGKRLDYADIALLATIGLADVRVYAKPAVGIVPTGDEIVDVDAAPLDHQIRNSNAYSLYAQVQRAGGAPTLLPVARDDRESTRTLLEQALDADLVLLSGGVSAGKYDLVERVLADMGAEFFFDRVLIQPGQPLVFGRVRGRSFFGLPGNPASTIVTFELFARPAITLLSGECSAPLRTSTARLTQEFRHKPGLTRFFPALVSDDGSELTPLPWKGSSDVPSLSRANCYLIADSARELWGAGDVMRVLPK
jgi:molybdopterin molybdotransferase